jgi:hypothetical protein
MFGCFIEGSPGARIERMSDADSKQRPGGRIGTISLLAIEARTSAAPRHREYPMWPARPIRAAGARAPRPIWHAPAPRRDASRAGVRAARTSRRMRAMRRPVTDSIGAAAALRYRHDRRTGFTRSAS